MDAEKKIFSVTDQQADPQQEINLTNISLLMDDSREIVLVAKDEEFITNLDFHFGPLGYKVAHSSEPLEIIERIDQWEKSGRNFPDVIIFNTHDFPRHWKPILKVIRKKKSHEECLFILAGGKDFQIDEAVKAAFLNANAILVDDFSRKNTITQLYEIIKRYKSLDDKRKYIRYIPRQSERFKFLFTHPVNKYLVSSNIVDISLAGACVTPTEPALIADLHANQLLTSCSLRVAEDILTVNCRIAYITQDLGLEFETLESKGHQKLFHYLMEIPRRKMKEQD